MNLYKINDYIVVAENVSAAWKALGLVVDVNWETYSESDLSVLSEIPESKAVWKIG